MASPDLRKTIMSDATGVSNKDKRSAENGQLGRLFFLPSPGGAARRFSFSSAGYANRAGGDARKKC
jgi:hypothetical protein